MNIGVALGVIRNQKIYCDGNPMLEEAYDTILDYFKENIPYNEMKPCPFCGGEPVIVEEMWDMDGVPKYLVRCKDCDSQNGEYDDEYEAIDAWNERIYKYGD